MPPTRQLSIADRAQRLWVLESASPAAEASGQADVFRFVNAIAVLGNAVVQIGFVRSCSAHGSTEGCLATPRVRLNIERHAASFPTLEAAIDWAESKRVAWIKQGWTEWRPDPDGV